MATLAETLQLLRERSDTVLHPPVGQPHIVGTSRIPDDLSQFYRLTGGIELFPTTDTPLTIQAPLGLRAANPEILGETISADITADWYVIATGRTGEYVTIDLSAERAGRCYDSFVDRHGVAGSCPIIALSFTEFLTRCAHASGSRRYWLETGFRPYGDAYGGT